MSKGPVSVQMLGGNQRVPGAAQFLHCHLLLPSWARTTPVNIKTIPQRFWCCYYKLTDPKTCQEAGVCGKMTVFVEQSLRPGRLKSQRFSLGKQLERLSHFGV